MSNPLDGRIRTLAREEAASMFATPATVTAADLNTDRVADLQQQITDLHEHLHHAATTINRLEARIDALEKVAGLTDQEQAAPASARRARRKTTEE